MPEKDKQFPLIMGIININKESFYAGSRCLSAEEAVERYRQFKDEGADICDLGACSTRPGSTPVTEKQEAEYLSAPLKALKCAMLPKECKIPRTYFRNLISIDTFRSSIVRLVYDILGEFTVNDISAGEDDPQMLKTVGELNLPYIAMHKRGTPATMGNMTDYPNGVVNEVAAYFDKFAEKAADAGITEYVTDPGFGFAKTIEQNYELLENLERFKTAGPGGHGGHKGHREGEYRVEEHRVLVGISRKSMIWKLLDITPEEALPATSALNMAALMHGADILRVHDVKEAVRCRKMYLEMKGLYGKNKKV